MNKLEILLIIIVVFMVNSIHGQQEVKDSLLNSKGIQLYRFKELNENLLIQAKWSYKTANKTKKELFGKTMSFQKYRICSNYLQSLLTSKGIGGSWGRGPFHMAKIKIDLYISDKSKLSSVFKNEIANHTQYYDTSAYDKSYLSYNTFEKVKEVFDCLPYLNPIIPQKNFPKFLKRCCRKREKS